MSRPDPRLAAALAVVLVGGVLLGILTLGRVHYPGFPSLRERPDPAIPGLIAWVRWDEASRDGYGCLWVAWASGVEPPRRLTCGPEVGAPVRWEPRGIVLETPSGTRVLDPVTGKTRGGSASTGGQPVHPPRVEPMDRTRDGVTLFPRADTPGRAELWLERADGTRRRVAFAEGPRDYAWWEAVWAPGGRYAAVHDSEQRLLIVDTESGLVRLLAEEAGAPVWGQWRASARGNRFERPQS